MRVFRFLPAFASFAAVQSRTIRSNSADCYYLPGDATWPHATDWSHLNDTVNGRLIQGKPLGEMCRGAGAGSKECNDIKATWTFGDRHAQDPVSIFAPYWLNNSCSPFATSDAPCTLGNLPVYAINVSRAEDVIAGLEFARRKNIRLVVKNTGHDFNGRSSGQGSLSLWTHNLKDISFFDYKGAGYKGPAVRMHAGVQAWEAYAAAAKQGVRIVGGFCPTVGLAGGYVQGAGHGPLVPTYGMAADNALEFEVVTADGKHLNVSSTQHPDLFWALSGGGGGNYAVVLSMVAKTHPDGVVAGATFTFNNTGKPNETENFWQGVTEWHKQLVILNNEPNFQAVYTVKNFSFQINFLTWPGKTKHDVNSALAPFRAELRKLNLNFTQNATDDRGYHEHYARYTPALPNGLFTVSEVLGGRLISRDALASKPEDLTNAIRSITADGRFVYNGISQNASHARAGNKPGDNAVLPAWRDAIISANLVVEWHPENNQTMQQLLDMQDEMTKVMVPKLEAVSPTSGTYMNEGTFDDPKWKANYYGVNYKKLLSVKKKYDARMMFYGRPNVGSEYWNRASDGRLCKA